MRLSEKAACRCGPGPLRAVIRERRSGLGPVMVQHGEVVAGQAGGEEFQVDQGQRGAGLDQGVAGMRVAVFELGADPAGQPGIMVSTISGSAGSASSMWGSGTGGSPPPAITV